MSQFSLFEGLPEVTPPRKTASDPGPYVPSKMLGKSDRKQASLQIAHKRADEARKRAHQISFSPDPAPAPAKPTRHLALVK